MDKITAQGNTLDWRFRTATTLANDWTSPYTNRLYKKGTFTWKTAYVKHQEREIVIGDPSAVALFLNQAYQFYRYSKENNPFQIERPPVDGTEPSVHVYNFLEQVMASIIFSYTALETFANEEIPEGFQFDDQTESGLFVVRNKEWIERNTKLDEKLASILPQALNVESPKGLKIWENYVQLRRLRHRIIHMKSADRTSSTADNKYPETLWSDLLKPNQINYPLAAKNIILHFRTPDSAHWLKFCPF